MKSPIEIAAILTPRTRLHRQLAVGLLFLVPLAVWSYNITEGLSVGVDAATNSLGANSSVMIGSNNSGSTPKSLAVGSSNSVGTASAGSGNLAAGHNNDVNGYQNYAFGHSNIVDGSFDTAIGFQNTTKGFSSLTWGQGNQILTGTTHGTAGGLYNIIKASGGVALGLYNEVESYGCTVVGMWNKPIGDEATNPAAKNSLRPQDPLFVVGNGTGANSLRKNALVVTKDGTVTITKVPAQGGISMGNYQ
jgi:hypothetical protein